MKSLLEKIDNFQKELDDLLDSEDKIIYGDPQEKEDDINDEKNDNQIDSFGKNNNSVKKLEFDDSDWSVLTDKDQDKNLDKKNSIPTTSVLDYTKKKDDEKKSNEEEKDKDSGSLDLKNEKLREPSDEEIESLTKKIKGESIDFLKLSKDTDLLVESGQEKLIPFSDKAREANLKRSAKLWDSILGND